MYAFFKMWLSGKAIRRASILGSALVVSAKEENEGAHGFKNESKNGESPVLRVRTSRISAYK